MDLMNNVAEGIQFCGLGLTDNNDCPSACPYKGSKLCRERLLDDVRKIIAACRPRLLEERDFELRINTDDSGYIAVWAEYRVAKGLMRGEDGWSIINRDTFQRTNFSFKRYWTKKPSEEQMKNTAW